MAAAGDPRGDEIPMRPFMRRPGNVLPHAWGFEEKFKQEHCHMLSAGIRSLPMSRRQSAGTLLVSKIMTKQKVATANIDDN